MLTDQVRDYVWAAWLLVVAASFLWAVWPYATNQVRRRRRNRETNARRG